jgi:hypothetical protein
MYGMQSTITSFIHMMNGHFLQPLLEREPDPIFGGGQGEEMFKKMLIDEYGKVIGDPFDLRPALERDLLAVQENTGNNSALIKIKGGMGYASYAKHS